VKYELGSYIPEDDILHSHRRENLKPYRRFYSHVVRCLLGVKTDAVHSSEMQVKYTTGPLPAAVDLSIIITLLCWWIWPVAVQWQRELLLC
jgi:hypothetical protein